MKPFRELFLLFILAVCANGCNKDSDDGPVPPQHVEWSIDNGTLQIAETISFIPFAGYNNIYATKGTTDISLSTLSTLPGSYSLAAGNGAMGLRISGTQWAILSCNITISSNTESRLKGTFTGTFGLVNVDTVNVTGKFEDVVY